MKIKELIQSNGRLLKNMTWLTVLQFANYLIPLIIIPYIVNVLGVEMFGKVSYAQNIISYFTLVINFGFEYSATRRIAINKNDKTTLSEIFWGVLKQKAILLLFSFAALVLLYFTFSRVHDDFKLYLFVFLLNVGVVLFPTWFFQGIEQMGKMAVFNVIIKALGLILTVVFVRSASDYLLYPLFHSIAYILCGVIALMYVVKHFQIPWVKTDKTLNKRLFKDGFPIFLNNLFVSGYTIANMTILGIFETDTVVGYYSGAYKIIMAVLMLTSMPINMAIYPIISRKFAESYKAGITYFKKSIVNLAVISLIVSIVTYFAAPLLVKIILRGDFEPAVDLLRLFSVLPFLVIMASLFTVQGLYGAGLQRYAPYVGASIGTFCIIFDIIMIPKYSMYAAALGWIISQALEIIISAFIFYKKKSVLSNT